MRSVAAQKIHHLLAGGIVGSNVARFAKPSAQLSRFAVGRRKDATTRFAGPPIVGTVERYSSEGITPKASFGFLLQPFAGLRSDLHSLSVRLLADRRDHRAAAVPVCCRELSGVVNKIFIRFRFALWRPMNSPRKAE